MKILFITYRLPYPPFSGERLRIYQILELLASEHELWLLTFVTSDREIENCKALGELGIRIRYLSLGKYQANLRRLSALFFESETPLQVAYYSDKRMQLEVSKTVAREGIDLVFTCLARMGQYFLEDTSAIQILDYMDAFSEYYYSRSLISKNIFAGIIDRIESRRLKGWEQTLLTQYDLTTIISPFDALKISPQSPPTVVPGHVDEYLNYQVLNHLTDELIGSPSIIFFGEMSTFYSENAVTFMVEKILPIVWESLPNVTFFVVGANPSKGIQRLACEHVIVTGFVEDVRDYIAHADVSVAPLQMGSGLKYKIVQSMAMGVPVVATSIANRGVQGENGRHLFVADTPVDFARSVLSLLENPSLRKAMASDALSFVKANFSGQSVSEKLVSILNELKIS